MITELMTDNSIVIECIKPIDHCNSVIMLNLPHDVNNAPGDKAHLGSGNYVVSRCLPVLARR